MRHERCKSCSLHAACRNGIPPSLPMCRAMVSFSIDADRSLLLSRHELVLGSFLKIGVSEGTRKGSRTGQAPSLLYTNAPARPPERGEILARECLRLT